MSQGVVAVAGASTNLGGQRMVPRRLASQPDWLHHADAVVLVAPFELHLHGALLVLLVLGVNQARMHQAVVRALVRLLGFRLRIIRA